MGLRPKTAVYLAASSADIERATLWRGRLLTSGFDVVSTWIGSVRADGAANPREASFAQRLGWAATCLREVNAAHVVWMLVPSFDRATRGAWVEVGYGQALGKPLVFSGVDTVQSVFCALGSEFADDEDAFRRIVEWAA